MYFSLLFCLFFSLFFFSRLKKETVLCTPVVEKKDKKQKFERQKSIVNLFDNDLNSGVGAQFLAAA